MSLNESAKDRHEQQRIDHKFHKKIFIQIIKMKAFFKAR